MLREPVIDLSLLEAPPLAYENDGKIPWNDPEFSRRMLTEHLTQAHDRASRREALIDELVDWIHGEVMGRQPGRILDLGCGPGLYSRRLAALGHACTGIDFSPAAIAYAREHATSETYKEADIRTADYGDDIDLAMLLYGEFNAFREAEVVEIVKRSHAALRPGGRLLLEVNTAGSIEARGDAPQTWYRSESGLFSDRPHLVLQKNFRLADEGLTVERYCVVDEATGESEVMSGTARAWPEAELAAMLAEAGFAPIAFSASDSQRAQELFTVLATRGP